MKLPVVLASRWGLDPVIVVPSSSSDGGESLCPSAETRNTSVKRCPKPTPPAPAPEAAEAAGGSPFSIISRDDGRDGAGNDDDDEDYIDDEPTGRVLWDCAQVLWDLVADPNPANVFSVKGKRVIELGGGTGALSVGLARAGADFVTCTDLPCHLARIQSTIRANARTSKEISSAANAENGSSSSGGGSVMGTDANHGEKLQAATPVPAPVIVAQEARIRVEILRWGEEEDLVRVRARVDHHGGSSGERADATKDGSGGGSSSGGGNASACFQSSLAEASSVIGDCTVVVAPRGKHNNSDDDSNSSDSGDTTSYNVDSEAKELEPVPDGLRNARGSDTTRGAGGGGAREVEAEAEAASSPSSSAFDVIVLSEVLYWPALDLLQEDTREPLRRTLVGLSKPGTRVILIYKERWPVREKEFLKSCEGSFEVRNILASQLNLPASTTEDPGSSAIRAVSMVRLLPPPPP